VAAAEERELAEGVARHEAAQGELGPALRRGPGEHDVEVLPRVAVAVDAGLGRELAELEARDEPLPLRVVEAREERARREGGEGLPGLRLRASGQACLLVNCDRHATAAAPPGEDPTRGARPPAYTTRRKKHLR